VLEKLQQEKLHLNLKKCSFLKSKLVYLGFFIFQRRVEDGFRKDKTSPRNIFEVGSFHGWKFFT